ncbi:putative RNA-directed DNA polymerase [Tanacetum coccineum]
MVIPTTDPHSKCHLTTLTDSSPSSVSHLSPTSQTSPESSNGQPSPVSTTSIPTPPPPTPPPPPPPPITRQRPANLRQNPKQRVPYNPSANHATVLPTTITEPTSFTVANNSPEWRQAMKEEYDALMKNGTWSLVPRASTTNVVDGKWVYRLKRDKNGAIIRYKARFVAKGCRQQPGIDFHETFSPVVKSTTIRAVLSLAVTNDWPLRQLDIQNAFLHGNLKEQSLYGLKQAPRAWFERLSKALFDLSNNKGTIDNIICQLGSAFALKDLGPLNYFLGIEIVPHVSGILLSQKKYILELLQSTGLSNCNPVFSPMVTSSSLTFAVNKVCQYMHAPTENHWSAVKRILGYLHGNPDTSLEAFSDTDWAGDSDDRRSTGGFAIYLALLHELGIRSSSTPILWCDNLGATYLSPNPIFHVRTKHVEIDYHFVREKVAQGDLSSKFHFAVFGTVTTEKYRFSSFKPADEANSAFRTFEIERLAAHKLFVAILSCYRSFSWSDIVLSVFSMVAACASRVTETLSATSFLMAA